MLAKRIIPCLDVKEGRVVKGTNFVGLRDAGDPVELAAFYDTEGADELVFLDITASHEKRKTVLDMVRRTAEQVFIPFTVGGGIGSVEDMRQILRAGADKIAINTAAVRAPDLIRRGAESFGSQCIVVAIDARRRRGAPGKPGSGVMPGKPGRAAGSGAAGVGEGIADGEDSGDRGDRGQGEDREGGEGREQAPSWEVFVHGGRTPTGVDAVEWAKTAESLGAGEILLTSMDADGTLAGYDNVLNRIISESTRIPLIASGGAGGLDHLRDAIVLGKADAVLAASIFHYGTYTVRQAKEFLRASGIHVRMAVPV